jgi:Rho guanine nucleotide exchange factor 4
MYAEALWDHVTMNEEELCFTAGQAIAVYDIDDPEWWFGLADDHIGWFPAAFVRVSSHTLQTSLEKGAPLVILSCFVT